MTVRRDADAIRLVGRCPAEDAETLLVALLDAPEAPVDLSEAVRLHMAVAQVLVAARPPVRGVPAGDFLARHLLGLLQ